MLVARLVKGVLKIRYLVLGGALGGGYTLQKVSKLNFWIQRFNSVLFTSSYVCNVLAT